MFLKVECFWKVKTSFRLVFLSLILFDGSVIRCWLMLTINSTFQLDSGSMAFVLYQMTLPFVPVFLQMKSVWYCCLWFWCEILLHQYNWCLSAISWPSIAPDFISPIRLSVLISLLPFVNLDLPNLDMVLNLNFIDT